MLYIPTATRQQLIEAIAENQICTAEELSKIAAESTEALRERVTAWIAEGDECSES
jgi:hypothetical protein